MAQNPHKKLTYWTILFLTTWWGISSRFRKKSNPNSSLVTLLIQIEKFQLNAWVSLANLPGTGCCFHNLIFRLAVFSIHQKQGYVAPFKVFNQINLSNNPSFASNTKNYEWSCPKRSLLVSLKSILLKTKNTLLCFWKWSYFQITLFLSKMLLFSIIQSVLY